MAAPKVTFTTGGTVQAGGGIYLKRSSDGELLEACQNGVFSYVLLPRQMGKSSLMTHAAQQLRSLGIHPVVIDLQAIGTQVTAENWYLGLLIILEEQLMLDTDILGWWEEHHYLGLTQRFTNFFEQVLLKAVTGQIVIFVDEIDTVLPLHFTDDFFIAIRYLHQNRAQNPDLYRLSFVLLGVAAPGDLIRDQKRTPFNIGQPIDLRGFTLAEIQPLSAGLAQVLKVSENQALDLLEAVLHWTGGQPFLTQKLCQFMVTHESRPGLGEEFPWVSELVQTKVIDRWEAQDTPPHLSTIRDRLARSGEKTARLLGLYQQLLEQGDLPADDRPEQVELRLTGLVVKRDGRLQVFNRIYEAVFNPTWVAQALADLRPYGEAIQEWLSSGRLDESRLLRGQALQEARQWAEGKSLGDDDRRFLDASLEIERREAELKFEAEREANRILTAARDEAEAKLRDAEQRKTEADRAVELANYKLQTINIQVTALASQAAYAKNDTLQALMLSLQAGAQYKALTSKGQSDRGKQDERTQRLSNSYYPVMESLQQALYNDQCLVINELRHREVVASLSFSPHGKMIVTGCADGRVWLWSRCGTLLKILEGHQRGISSVSCSPDGQMLVTASLDNTVKLWNSEGTLLKTLEEHQGEVLSVSCSPDGQMLATASLDNTVKLWGSDGILIKTFNLPQEPYPFSSVSFSPDGQTIVTGTMPPDPESLVDLRDYTGNGMVMLWHIDGTLIKTLEGHRGSVYSVSFSPDGQAIATGGYDRTVRLWNRDGDLLYTFKGHDGSIQCLSFSPDGETIASGSEDKTVRLWNRNGDLLYTFKGHDDPIYWVSFSPDGEVIASGGKDKTVKLWCRYNTLIKNIEEHQGYVFNLALSSYGQIIIDESFDNAVNLWNRQNNLDRFLAMGCYWTADYRKHQTDSETNQLINATCERPEVKAELPDLLRTQATETTKTGNYAAALKFLQDAQLLDPQINLTPDRLKALAGDTIQRRALQYVQFRDLGDLAALKYQQALWLLDQAKSINPDFDLVSATQEVQQTCRDSIAWMVNGLISWGDICVRKGQRDEALKAYYCALDLDPTLPFTPESRIQEQSSGYSLPQNANP